MRIERDSIVYISGERPEIRDTIVVSSNKTLIIQQQLSLRFLPPPIDNVKLLEDFITSTNESIKRISASGNGAYSDIEISATDIIRISRLLQGRYKSWVTNRRQLIKIRGYAEEQRIYWKKMEETALLLIN